MKLINWRKAGASLAIIVELLVSLSVPQVASATCDPSLQSCSGSYGVSETYFGSGGDLSDCSSSYCAKIAVGELGVGNTSSPTYQAQAGFNTNRAPYLQFVVTGGSTDLGVLKTNQASTTTTTFSIETYLAGGYIVQTVSPPPTSTLPPYPQLHALTSPDISRPGTEQFGINLAHNTSPALGQTPVCDTSSFCNVDAGKLTVNPNYGQTNEFYYNNTTDNTLATSSASSGMTDFTISYLFNISNVTTAGIYAFNQVLVATSTY